MAGPGGPRELRNRTSRPSPPPPGPYGVSRWGRPGWRQPTRSVFIAVEIPNPEFGGKVGGDRRVGEAEKAVSWVGTPPTAWPGLPSPPQTPIPPPPSRSQRPQPAVLPSRVQTSPRGSLGGGLRAAGAAAGGPGALRGVGGPRRGPRSPAWARPGREEGGNFATTPNRNRRSRRYGQCGAG